MTARSNLSNIPSLLHPKSIAITGASSNPEELGSFVLRNIVMNGYEGRVFPVSSKLNELYNFDTYNSIRDINEEVDLAVLATPVDEVIDDVYDCTRSNVKNICIITRGFVEKGQSGMVLQKKIAKMAGEAGIRVVGPNSLGIISTKAKLSASFSRDFPHEGNVNFISQSGSLINALIEFSNHYNMGLGEIISLGNKADLSEVDLFKYYSTIRDDGLPGAIGFYLENIKNGREFLDYASQLSKKIPLVGLIPSKEKKLDEFVYSHSGSVLQNDEVIDLALKKTGVIRAYSQQQLYDYLLAFGWQTVPRGNKVAVISNAGGGLILAIDQLYKNNLELVNFSSEVKQLLNEEMRWNSDHGGVVDLGGEAHAANYIKALDIILGDYDVNAVVVILSPQIMTEIEETAEAIGRLAREHGKTVIATFMGYDDVVQGVQSLSKYFIPTYHTTEQAVQTLSKLYEYFLWQKEGEVCVTKYSIPEKFQDKRQDKIVRMIEEARLEKKTSLSLTDCIEILRYYDLDIKSINQVDSLKEIITFGSEQKYPFELKCLSTGKSYTMRDKAFARNFFDTHFEKVPQSDDHKLGDHVIRKTYDSEKGFRVQIVKDTYYEQRIKETDPKKLRNLSFGHYLNIYVPSQDDALLSVLLPVSRSGLDKKLFASGFYDLLKIKNKETFNLIRDDIIDILQTTIHISGQFDQLLEVKSECVIAGDEIEIVDCGMKLDLMV